MARQRASDISENIIWDIRAFVYRHFADTTCAPSVDEAAAAFAMTHEAAASVYEDLHARHALYLKPDSDDILMANPFSNIETPFHVYVEGKTYFANCAWDSLGIPAALHCDADVEAVCAQSGQMIALKVRDEQISESDVLVHFLVPFEHWYDDLVFT